MLLTFCVADCWIEAEGDRWRAEACPAELKLLLNALGCSRGASVADSGTASPATEKPSSRVEVGGIEDVPKCT